MSRRRTKHRKTADAQSVVDAAAGRNGKTVLILEIAAVFVLAVIPFALGRICELNQPDPFDSGAYVYSAQHILSGARLNVDEIVSAQPATLAVNMLGVRLFGFGELGPKLVQMFLQAAAIAMLYFTARVFFNRTAAVVSAALAAIYLSAPFVGKYGNVKEQYMVAFMILAVCFWMRSDRPGRLRLLIPAGACMILPYYFKPTGVSIIIAAGVYLSLSFLLGGLTFRRLLEKLLLLGIGAVIGLAPLAGLYARQGQFEWLQDTLPFVLLRGLFVFLATSFLLIWLAGIIRKIRLMERLRTVRRPIWLTGLAMILLMYLAGAMLIVFEKGSCRTDVLNFIRQTPPVRQLARVWAECTGFTQQLYHSADVDNLYISSSRAIFGWSQQTPIVLRYYRALCLPIMMGLISLSIAAVCALRCRLKKTPSPFIQDSFVWALGLWWLMDVAFVWASPRSYEQYYLPMCGSAAVLSGYGLWRFTERFAVSRHKTGYAIVGVGWAICAFFMVLPIFIGQTTSPFSGQKYGQWEKRRGYAQALAGTWDRLKTRDIDPWEQLAAYIKQNSTPEDMIYVWGWYPGIYVQARRFCPLPRAFESEMHTANPKALCLQIQWMIEGFEKTPPLFMIDSRKPHFPWNRPSLELWPIVPAGMSGNKSQQFLGQGETAQYEQVFGKFLLERYGPDEAGRFDTMKPLRDYVMNNYRIVRMFGPHVLFVRKQTAETAG